MPVRTKNYYVSTIELQDENGQPLRAKVHVKRFGPDELSRFQADYKRCGEPPSLKALCRMPDGPEQEKDEQDNYIVSEDVVRARRLADMTPEQRAAWDRQDREDEAFAKDFLTGAITEYVSVPEGEIVDIVNGEEKELRTGDDLVRAYGAQEDVLRQLVRAVWNENTMSPHQKKVWRSLSNFQRSLNEQVLVAAGPKPDATVGSVAGSVSAPTEDATELTAALSGSVAGT